MVSATLKIVSGAVTRDRGWTAGSWRHGTPCIGTTQQVSQRTVDTGSADQQILAVEFDGESIRTFVEVARAGAGLPRDEQPGGEVPWRDAFIVGVQLAAADMAEISSSA